MNPLKQYPLHKKILDELFGNLPFYRDDLRILDAGSGRTSLYYLCETFPGSNIDAIVYPGDTRKIDGIKSDVKFSNYELIETDVMDIDESERHDLVLAHLLLGESYKFEKYKSKAVLEKLLNLKFDYLILIDIKEDKVTDWESILGRCESGFRVLGSAYVDKYVGIVITPKYQ